MAQRERGRYRKDPLSLVWFCFWLLRAVDYDLRVLHCRVSRRVTGLAARTRVLAFGDWRPRVAALLYSIEYRDSLISERVTLCAHLCSTLFMIIFVFETK